MDTKKVFALEGFNIQRQFSLIKGKTFAAFKGFKALREPNFKLEDFILLFTYFFKPKMGLFAKVCTSHHKILRDSCLLNIKRFESVRFLRGLRF